MSKDQGRCLSCLRWRQKAHRNHIGLLYQGAQDRTCCVLCAAAGFDRESGVCEGETTYTGRASVQTSLGQHAPPPPLLPTLLRSQQRLSQRPASPGKVGARSLEPSVRGRADAHNRPAQPQQKVQQEPLHIHGLRDPEGQERGQRKGKHNAPKIRDSKRMENGNCKTLRYCCTSRMGTSSERGFRPSLVERAVRTTRRLCCASEVPCLRYWA